MANLERRSTLAKAPSVDVVAALTTAAPEPPELAATRLQEAEATVASRDASASTPDGIGTVKVRRGPGRPRSRRRMEPFSSKIEIGLRDLVDVYLDEHDMTIVDFLDEALRDRLAK